MSPAHFNRTDIGAITVYHNYTEQTVGPGQPASSVEQQVAHAKTPAEQLAEQRDFLAIALVRFLDLCGGADGTECGRGDPRVVRGLAVAALDKAGIAYGKSNVPLPGLVSAGVRPYPE